jgi:hypothetical protein
MQHEVISRPRIAEEIGLMTLHCEIAFHVVTVHVIATSGWRDVRLLRNHCRGGITDEGQRRSQDAEGGGVTSCSDSRRGIWGISFSIFLRRRVRVSLRRGQEGGSHPGLESTVLATISFSF